MNKRHVRRTLEKDIPALTLLFENARIRMHAGGNPNQWVNGYPGEEEIREDMSRETSYVIEEDGKIIGTFALIPGEDETYRAIDGAWLNSLPYAAVHRIAGDGQAHGIVKTCVEWCSHRCPNLKIDTHENNIPMQKALVAAGFIRCGIIRIFDGSPRVAYQRLAVTGTGTEKLISAMTAWEIGVPERVQHFLKVHTFSMAIADGEGLDPRIREILGCASLVHDIGIRPALRVYNSAAGPYQEELGREPAKEMLLALGYDEELAERCAYLVGHHHSYSAIDGADYQILVEADFLVNIFEGKMPKDEILSVREKIFKTRTGIRYLDTMFLA